MYLWKINDNSEYNCVILKAIKAKGFIAMFETKTGYFIYVII